VSKGALPRPLRAGVLFRAICEMPRESIKKGFKSLQIFRFKLAVLFLAEF
jgi:hypothetical protein